MFAFLHYTASEILAIIGTIVLLFLLFSEIYEWIRMLFGFDTLFYLYNYKELGPAKWKEIFPASKGKRQSPINICSSLAVVILETNSSNTIKFSEYHVNPCELRAYNDNNCVIVCGKWRDERPFLCGGPLKRIKYQFFNARFRWGLENNNGSEHAIDNQRFAMELQLTHIKGGKSFPNFKAAAEAHALLILTYFFQITPMDNPFLKPLVSSLEKIICPFSYCTLDSTPLSWFAPPFHSKYFTYKGSLTFPPCTEGVNWIIQPEPLAISNEQMNKFRMIQSLSGPIEMNTRPVQNVNKREIWFYD